MSDNRATDEDVVPPKLTIGQRLLAALPNLQRPSPRPGTEDATDAEEASDAALAVHAGAEDEDAAEDARATTRSGTSTGKARTRATSGTRPSAGGRGPVDLMEDYSDEEIAQRIKKLDDRERFLVLFAGPLGAVVGIVLTILTFHLNPAAGKANHETASIILLEGGV
ncbi:MAG TPA: hypothetical protein VMF60_09135, partial [Acidimicrobiales bacterium]|nr:hypothetical protein [Acidimicrobiales bacterium]